MRNVKYLGADMMNVIVALHNEFPDWELEKYVRVSYKGLWKQANPYLCLTHYSWEYELGPMDIHIGNDEDEKEAVLSVLKRDRDVPDSKITRILDGVISKRDRVQFVPHREDRERSEWRYRYKGVWIDADPRCLQIRGTRDG